MNHQLHICPNGLTVLTSPRPSSQLVSVQVWVGTGSTLESRWLGSGISHLLEHQVFKGTAELDGETLNRRVPELGGSWNAYTSSDRTVYHINGPSEHWREFLHLLVQMVFHPSFPEGEFERERDVIRREMDMYADKPHYVAYNSLVQTLYKVNTKRLPVIGHRAQFDALRYEDMVAYHRERYVPGNVFICVGGDVDPAELFRAAEEETADVPAAPMPQVLLPQEPRQWGPRTFRREFAKPTSTLILAWRTPDSNHPDTAALSMLAAILGHGRSSWLYKYFHDKLGTAHSVYSAVMPDRDGEGAFVIEADVDRANRDSLRDALMEYVSHLPEQDFAEARVRACNKMKVARLHALSEVKGTADALGMAWHMTRNPNRMEEWESALSSVTDEDIARVAREYLVSDRVCEVSVDPKGSNAADGADDAYAGLEAVEMHTLPNGLRLATRVDRSVPLAYATLAFAAGCPVETEQTAGINTLMAECLLKGTDTRSAAELADAVENLGGNIQTAAGDNELAISVSGLAQDMDSLLELMADAVQHPSFPADAVDKEKNAMVADILDSMEDPSSLAFRRVRYLCFGNVSYGNHSDGTVESVESLQRKDLVDHAARILCARNAVLSVVGDIDPAAIRAYVERLFCNMPSGMPATGIPTPAQVAADVQEPSDKEQAVLVLAVPGCTATAEDVAEQLIFTEWCRDMAGPIFAEIREKRGLAYYAAAKGMPGVDAGCMFFYLGTAPEKCAEARAALESTLSRIAQEGMPADALERSRATLLASRTFAMQSGKKLANGMAVNELLGLGAAYDDQVPALLRAVTTESMHAYIRRILSPDTTRTWMQVGGV